MPKQSNGDQLFAFDAYVIEEGPLGTYPRIRGTVASAVDPAHRPLRPAHRARPGHRHRHDAAGAAVHATRIFDRAGTELERADITVDRTALVDGILVIGDDDLLRSPLVILGDVAPTGEATLEGRSSPSISSNARCW